MAFHVINTIMRFAVVALVVVNSYGQNGCGSLNKEHPLIFITYDRVANDKILLALHNNTSCAIYVRSNGTPTLYRVISLSDGKTKLEKRSDSTVYDLSDAEILHDLVFELRDTRFSDRRISTTADGDLFFSRRIPSGVTVYFTVRRSSFTRRANLVVPFRYEWEENAVPVVSGNAVHGVYFVLPERRK
jgi:hypothetical protein